jgi:ATP-dependent exoDNAse (exonuclease V) beta subunit
MTDATGRAIQDVHHFYNADPQPEDIIWIYNSAKGFTIPGSTNHVSINHWEAVVKIHPDTAEDSNNEPQEKIDSHPNPTKTQTTEQATRGLADPKVEVTSADSKLEEQIVESPPATKQVPTTIAETVPTPANRESDVAATKADESEGTATASPGQNTKAQTPKTPAATQLEVDKLMRYFKD